MMKKMPEKKEELREAFKTFDADGDGCTTRSELRRVMMIKFGQNLTDPELDAVMLEVDKNRDGVISFSNLWKQWKPTDLRRSGVEKVCVSCDSDQRSIFTSQAYST